MKHDINDGNERVGQQFLTPETRERIHKAIDKLLDNAHRGITLSATGLCEDGGARQLAVVAGRFTHFEGVYSILSSAQKTLEQLDYPKAATAAQALSELIAGLRIAFQIVDASVEAKAAQHMENVTWH